MDSPQGICPAIQDAFEILGRKWSALILHLLLLGELHFCELQRGLPDLSDRILSRRLKDLEEAGLVERHVCTAAPVRVSYSLSPRGAALRPVLEGIAVWAHAWPAPSTTGPRDQGLLG